MPHPALNALALDLIARKEAAGTLPPGAGIALSVVRNGEVLLSCGYGLRERDRRLPVTPDTVFPIASSTKAFTATALVLASERGRLDLDGPMNANRTLLRLSDPEVTRQLSVADVLSHRSGLPSNDFLWYFGAPTSSEPAGTAPDPRALHEAIARLPLLPDGFRHAFVYNNLLYGTLGHLFDTLAGEPWEPYVARHLLGPLGMTATSFGPAPDSEPNVALPYVGQQRVHAADMSPVAAAGAMRSTLADMTRWMTFQLGDGTTPSGARLLSTAALARMRERHVLVENANPALFQGLEWLGPETGYGLGWFLGQTRGLKVAYHPGLIDGYTTALVMIPEKRLGFVALTNVNCSDVPGLLIQELLGALLTAEGQNLTPPAAAPAPAPTPEQRAVLGDYVHPAFGRVTVALAEGPTGAHAGLVLSYHGGAWSLTLKDDAAAEVVVPAFGLQIPLPVAFELKDGRASQLAIPFSLDPRVGLEVFTRTSA